jgi:surface polysaccharide O-acyltransferase-like enzyme
LAGKGKSIADFVTLFIKGFYHLWFIYMMICLYMIVPFLRKIIIDNNLTKYFLVLSFIFAVVIPETTQVIDVFSSEYGLLANTVVNQTHMHFVLGFSVYYVAGYYLNNTALSKKTTNIIYLFGAIGFISTIVLTSLISKRLNIPTQLFYQYNSPNVFLEAVSVFVLIKNISGKIKFSDKSAKILTALSKYCFGAYLIHALVLSSLSNFAKINSNLFNPLLSIPLISFTILIISLVVSAVLNRIPVVKKYLV